MKFIADRFKTKKYWKQYLSWQYWKDQHKIGNEHYKKTLKEVVPSNIYNKHYKKNVIYYNITFILLVIALLDSMFSFIPVIFLTYLHLVVWIGITYYAFWELKISRYTLPNIKKFIVRNSPVQELASLLATVKTVKNPVLMGCVGCLGSFFVIDAGHKILWPDAVTPAEHLGNFISNKTGYIPTPKNK
jgi:hypothetical protein